MIKDVCMGTSRLSTHELYIEEKCAQCGKIFLRSGEHVYRRMDGNRQLMYCSYTCLRIVQREEEARARREYEEECAKIRAKEEWESRYVRAKKLCRGEEVVVRSKQDAEDKLKEAKVYIQRYLNSKLQCVPGTHERLRASKNLMRWKRKAAYLRGLLEAIELEEQEERTECTTETGAL